MADKKSQQKFGSWKTPGLMIQWMTEKWNYMPTKAKLRNEPVGGTRTGKILLLEALAVSTGVEMGRAGNRIGWKLHKRDI